MIKSYSDFGLPSEMEAALESLNRYHRKQFTALLDADRQRPNKNSKAPKLNVHGLLRDLAKMDLVGENREFLEDSARRDGVTFDPVRPYLSFRDLSVAAGSAGGYLVQTDVKQEVDILRPWSVLARSGLQVEFGLVGNQVVPKVSAKTTPNWLTTESSAATASTPTLSEAALTPKTAAGTLQYSHLFSKQTNAPRFAARELLRTTGTAIDQAILSGTGAAGQPLGILNTIGIQTQSGTSLNSGVFTMKRKAAEANVTDEQIQFLSTPAVRELLETRERATGGGRFVWQGDQVADRPAFVSTDVPAATMLCTDWSLVYLGVWGSGIILELNPYEQSNFPKGIVQARVLITCDLAVLQPAAVVVATSIT